MTLQLLWLEYRNAHPNGYAYSWFCKHYKRWRGRLDVVLRQHYRGGEKAFVDYVGPKFEVVDRSTGEVRDAMVFVGVLAASNYTFMDLTWSRTLPDWTLSHVRMFEVCCGPEYVAESLERPVGHEKSLYQRNIISFNQSVPRKAISPLLCFHGRAGPGSAASHSAIAFAFISRSISA